jgi:hypothetical protein
MSTHLRRSRVRVVIVTLLLLSITACGGARNTLGTPSSVCFKALPGAKDAVNQKGSLVGVRKIQALKLQRHLPQNHQLALIPSGESLCVFAFHGKYQPSDVPQAAPHPPGSYAVVALTVKNPNVVAAIVLDQLPTRFRHNRV